MIEDVTKQADMAISDAEVFSPFEIVHVSHLRESRLPKILFQVRDQHSDRIMRSSPPYSALSASEEDEYFLRCAGCKERIYSTTRPVEQWVRKVSEMLTRDHPEQIHVEKHAKCQPKEAENAA